MIFIGMNHPKHFWMFKRYIEDITNSAKEYIIFVSEKDMLIELLEESNFRYIRIGTNKRGLIRKGIQILIYTIIIIYNIVKYNPRVLIGQALPHFALSSFLLRKPFIIFEDTENAVLPHLISNPFASVIITPSFFEKNFGRKQIKVNGSFELTYLSSDYFKPNKNVLDVIGMKEIDKYTLIRFVSWSANHDIGHKGISQTNKLKAVNEFSKFGKVFISSEVELPNELKKYQIRINPLDMHSIIYYASLVYGESATMAAEASYLGTPSIYLDNVGRGYTNELQKYNLISLFTESETDQLLSIVKGINILKNKEKTNWKKNASILQQSKINMFQFINWFIEDYPESLHLIKSTPDYLKNFNA